MEEWERNNNGHSFIRFLEDSHLKLFEKIEKEHGFFIVKMHTRLAKPTVKKLLEKFKVKVTVCYRDPRDIILSAIDHGVRFRKGFCGSGGFEHIFNIEDGIREFKKWSYIYYEWKKYENVLMIKYEDLMTDQLTLLKRINDYLGVNLENGILKSIYEKRDREKILSWNYNKGTIYRWRHEMPSDLLKKCNELLSEDIIKMGYSLY